MMDELLNAAKDMVNSLDSAMLHYTQAAQLSPAYERLKAAIKSVEKPTACAVEQP